MEYFVLFLVLVSFVAMTAADMIDMRREVANIVRFHNKLRREPRASDMTEMVWDTRLVRQAQAWADTCNYQRPNQGEANVGSNLFFDIDFVHGRRSVHQFVNTALNLWARGKKTFEYLKGCGPSCSYSQMVNAEANRLGCAINKCPSLRAGSRTEGPSSILVCFYSPRGHIYSAVPYKRGSPCSACEAGMICRKGLCANAGERPVPDRFLNINKEEMIQGINKTEDKLTLRETHFLSRSINNMRETQGLETMEWDDYLDRWANWIVSCSADYPGPPHSFTNFHRFVQGAAVYRALYEWQREGDVVDLAMVHGCRTPNDREKCNHYTNVRQPMLTSMACATKDCKDGTRQMVCLFDSKLDRNNPRPRRVSAYTASQR